MTRLRCSKCHSTCHSTAFFQVFPFIHIIKDTMAKNRTIKDSAKTGRLSPAKVEAAVKMVKAERQKSAKITVSAKKYR